ncbi:MAG TPA: dTMP kinase [Patescibacteria group bacterium]|nr:dTMP kinase [Patescibacteria group bacterium]
MHGKLIVIDALDGAGKSTVIRAISNHLEQQGLRVFDLVNFMQTTHDLPEATDPLLQEADVLLSAEPTHCWIGSAIRKHLVQKNVSFAADGYISAYAYALDRLVLFSRVIIPWLEAKPNRWVIQDRGLITSLAYQPLQDSRVTQDWLMSLEGNKIELSRPPDLLLLLRLAPEEAMQRIAGRLDKKDGHIFETMSFQEQLAARYRDPSVLAPYQNAGTPIIEINAARAPDQVQESVLAELGRFFPNAPTLA